MTRIKKLTTELHGVARSFNTKIFSSSVKLRVLRGKIFGEKITSE